MFDSFLLQLEQLYDALDPILIPGLLYLLVRGRRHLRGERFAVGVPFILSLSYIALFSLAASGWIQERYYRPIIPFAAILAAMGYYCLGKDFPKKKILYPIIFLALAACLWDGMDKPLRYHRRPQTLAGLWLARHDPDYTGFVVSNYTQPVYFAGMRYFDPECTKSLFMDLQKADYSFKYIIVDGDEGETWYARYAREKDWKRIYTETERNIRIYQKPDYDPAATTAPETHSD